MGARCSAACYSRPGGRLDGRPDGVHLERSADVLREVAATPQGRGVTRRPGAVQPLRDVPVNTAGQALELVELIGAPNVGVHLDAYHMNIEEDGFDAPIRMVGDRLVHFHLSESHRGIPGTGTVAWEDVMGALDAIGYDGYVGLESFEEIARRCARRPACGATWPSRATRSCPAGSRTSRGSSRRDRAGAAQPSTLSAPGSAVKTASSCVPM